MALVGPCWLFVRKVTSDLAPPPGARVPQVGVDDEGKTEVGLSVQPAPNAHASECCVAGYASRPPDDSGKCRCGEAILKPPVSESGRRSAVRPEVTPADSGDAPEPPRSALTRGIGRNAQSRP